MVQLGDIDVVLSATLNKYHHLSSAPEDALLFQHHLKGILFVAIPVLTSNER